MNRMEALRAGSGLLASFAGLAPAGPATRPVPLSEFAFAVGINARRALGVLRDSPEIVIVDDAHAATRRLFVPQALEDLDGWQPARSRASAAATDVDTQPGSDVLYGHILDRATGFCGGNGGAYVAMLAFPTRPYLVFYEIDRDRFWTRTLPSGQAVIGLFVQPGRLYYGRAGDPELPLVHSVDSVHVS